MITTINDSHWTIGRCNGINKSIVIQHWVINRTMLYSNNRLDYHLYNSSTYLYII